MTTDKLTNAVIAIITAVNPDPGITVKDARSQEEISLPTIAVSVEPPEKHSNALPGVMKCPLAVTLRAHPGDGETRATLKSWCDTIEQALNDAAAVKNAISGGGHGLQCDNWRFEGGSTKWDEATFEAEFACEAWVVRTA